MATISTHNGSQANRDHNLRNPKVVSKEKHIDPYGEYEVWHDEKPREAYRRLFGDALAEYNAKTVKDRQIKDYYTHVSKDAKKHPVYEMIVGVYNADVPDAVKKGILREFVDGWKDRNPNLELIGAYWHNDEQGEQHVHIDYVPVAHGYKKGLKVQSALVRALEEQGFWTSSKHLTAQICWQSAENLTLEMLCADRGIVVEHPEDENRKHLNTETYKAKKQLESTIDHYNDLDELITQRESEMKKVEKLRKERDELKAEIKELKHEAQECRKRYRAEQMTEDKVYSELFKKYKASGDPKRGARITGEVLVAVDNILEDRRRLSYREEKIKQAEARLGLDAPKTSQNAQNGSLLTIDKAKSLVKQREAEKPSQGGKTPSKRREMDRLDD